jgi:negative regulator of flagellin synthesis FlgM
VTTRIKGTDSQAVEAGSNRQVERVRRTAATPAASSAPGQTAESVQITDAARQMNSLSQAIGAVPEVDTQRVSALAQSIDQGQYQINSGRIADRLLQLEGDLTASAVAR